MTVQRIETWIFTKKFMGESQNGKDVGRPQNAHQIVKEKERIKKKQNHDLGWK